MKCYVELCLTKTFHLAYFSNFTNPHKSDKSVIDVTIVKWGFIIYSTLEILISSEEKKDSEEIITQQKEPKLKFIWVPFTQLWVIHGQKCYRFRNNRNH